MLIDSLPRSLRSESWYFHSVCLQVNLYILGPRNSPLAKFIVKHKTYLLVNSVSLGNVRVRMSVSKLKKNFLKMSMLICGKDREGEEGHKDNTGNNGKSSLKRGKSHHFAILSNHNESSPKGQRKQNRKNIILELEF